MRANLVGVFADLDTLTNMIGDTGIKHNEEANFGTRLAVVAVKTLACIALEVQRYNDHKELKEATNG